VQEFAMTGRSRSIPKRAANVSVRSDLLEEARAAGVNLSAALERALGIEIAELKRKRWLEVNRDAIEAYNEYCEKHGVFSDEVRSF
jgi:antitoxin CcdA